MLRSMNDLHGYAIQATDGGIGHVVDFYFDDAAWVVRYLVVDTGSWLQSRKVLISPISIGRPDWTEKVLPVSMTREQVRNSPDIDTDKPVSRQHEVEYLTYYNYPYYWGDTGLWGGEMYPNMMIPGRAGLAASPRTLSVERKETQIQGLATVRDAGDPHLRSCKAVTGYHIHAVDGDIGHVQGLLLDEDSWAIRYLVVDTSNWWLGHKVLIAPQWIEAVSWPDSTVSVDMTRQAVQDAPPYDPAAQLDREQEIGIYKSYGRAVYWTE